MDSLNNQQDVWMALSDLFVDNEVSHEYIAKRVAHLSIKQVEHILYYEIAPVCMSNLLVLRPSICKGFGEEYLIPRVQEHLLKMDTDKFYTHKSRLKIKIYKVFLGREWRKVATEIHHIQLNISNTLLPTRIDDLPE